jgi:hypothetical protein
MPKRNLARKSSKENSLDSRIVHARLDSKTSMMLEKLSQLLNQNESELIRKAIQLLAVSTPSVRRKQIVGVGKFASTTNDLGSNKRHLAEFGR